MENKHTPGPWQVGPTPKTTDVIYGPMGTVATLFENNQANARLIAAAPEMLEALREARIAMNHHGIVGDPAQFAIDAAIAKAVGK